eukprot:3654004-Prymnesium_polylepis.1
MAAHRRMRARCSSLRNRLLGRQVRLRHRFDPLRPKSRSRPGHVLAVPTAGRSSVRPAGPVSMTKTGSKGKWNPRGVNK